MQPRLVGWGVRGVGRSNLPQKSPTVLSEPKFGPPKIPGSAPGHVHQYRQIESRDSCTRARVTHEVENVSRLRLTMRSEA